MKMQKILVHEILWFILATAVLLFLSYGPIVRNFLVTPPDRYYYGQSEYPLDMLGDLAYVQQGYQGNLLASFNYGTLIGGHPSIVKAEYTVIGLVGRALNISPLSIFVLSRFVISVCVLVAIYAGIRRIFSVPWQRIMSYVFVIFGAGIILPGIPNHFVGYDAEVFPRLTQAMPHYLLGAGTMLIALYCLSRTLEKPQRITAFFASLVFGIVSSLLYAPDNVLLISGFPLYIALDSIGAYLRTKRVRVNTAKVGILFAYSAVTIAPIIFVRFIMTSVWNDIRVARLESLFQFRIPPVEYILAAGALYVLSFVAIPAVIRKGNPLLVLLATWVVMHPVGEYIISPVLHINYFRYFLTPYYVAFAILGATGIIILSDWIYKQFQNISKRILVSVFAGIVLLSGIGTYVASWREEHLCFCLAQFYDFAYPKKTVMDGVFWLQKNTNPADIVLSEYYTGTLIAAFSGNHPYVTWWYRLIEPPTLGLAHTNLTTFYGGSMPSTDAHAFLKRENIRYVFYSETERTYAPKIHALTYPFLTERYSRDGTVIYQVQ